MAGIGNLVTVGKIIVQNTSVDRVDRHTIMTENKVKLLESVDMVDDGWDEGRPIDVKLLDTNQQPWTHAAHFSRPRIHWNSNGVDLRLKVECPPGNVIGYVDKKVNWFSIEYIIQGGDGQPILKVKGKNILTINPKNQKIGEMKDTSTWTNRKLDMSFPVDLHVNLKVLLLGAFFFILSDGKKNAASQARRRRR